MKPRSIIVLSEARSGSNWLTALMAANKGWGHCREWLNPAVHKLPRMQRLGDTALMAMIAQKAVSPATDVLAVKVFTHHLTRFHQLYGYDPLQRIARTRDTLFLRLERRDRVAQAISLEIARQSGAWKSTSTVQAAPVYDFGQILRAYMKIGASYAFWDSYCSARPTRQALFYYEDLTEDPTPWLAACAEFTGHPMRRKGPKPTRLTIQRDARNDDWAARFHAEVKDADLLAGLIPAPRSLPRQVMDLMTPRRAARQFDL